MNGSILVTLTTTIFLSIPGRPHLQAADQFLLNIEPPPKRVLLEERLGGELLLVTKYNLTLLGTTGRGGVVVSIASQDQAALFDDSMVTKIGRRIPDQYTPVRRLLISSTRGHQPKSQTLKRAGLRVVESERGGEFIIAVPRKPVNAAMIREVLRDDHVVFISPDYQVSTND